MVLFFPKIALTRSITRSWKRRKAWRGQCHIVMQLQTSCWNYVIDTASLLVRLKLTALQYQNYQCSGTLILDFAWQLGTSHMEFVQTCLTSVPELRCRCLSSSILS